MHPECDGHFINAHHIPGAFSDWKCRKRSGIVLQSSQRERVQWPLIKKNFATMLADSAGERKDTLKNLWRTKTILLLRFLRLKPSFSTNQFPSHWKIRKESNSDWMYPKRPKNQHSCNSTLALVRKVVRSIPMSSQDSSRAGKSGFFLNDKLYTCTFNCNK